MGTSPMRYLVWALLAVSGLTGLGACQSTQPVQTAVVAGDLPPIAPDYRARISAWARGFYAEPRRLRATQITDPKLIRDHTGRLLWLVCIEASARDRAGAQMAAQRQAFGFAPGYFSAPLERNRATLVREDCDDPSLAWRPWPELQRL
jgi:hypothetical protein